MISLSIGLIAVAATGFVLALALVGAVVAASFSRRKKKQNDLEGFG